VTGSLSGSVLPVTATQKVQWQSIDTTIAKVDASGKVTAITAGATRIFARSQADSTKKDSVDITVKRDSPQVTAGHDTVVTVGTTLTFTPVVAPQEYGVVTQFKWDLDGNLVWDDSSTIVKSVSYKFDVEKEYGVRFYVRDTEGNETIVSQKVKATKGPTVTFLTPLTTGTYLTRLSTVDITGGSTTPQGPGAIKKVTYMVGTTVGTLSTNLATNGTGTWSIRGIPLVNNATVDIKVIATDSFGISGQSVLSIQMDSPTASLPKWTWTSGGGGTRDFRFKLGDANFSGTEPTVKVLEYPLASAITKTLYTLYVEERDVAGNWSVPASLSILYDLSKPTVSITKPQSSGTYLTRLGSVDLAGGTTSPQGTGTIKTLVYTIDGVAGTLATNLLGDGTWSIKAIPLVNNTTVAIKVTATDNLGNQGEATVSVSMDATAPASPVLVTPPVIVNSSDARTSLQWTWSRTGAASDSFIVKMNGVTNWNVAYDNYRRRW
jgi:Bacterial Ig-like domain (group 2)